MSVVVIGMDYPDNCLQCSFVRIVSGHYYCGCNANCMLGEYVGEVDNDKSVILGEIAGIMELANALKEELKK